MSSEISSLDLVAANLQNAAIDSLRDLAETIKLQEEQKEIDLRRTSEEIADPQLGSASPLEKLQTIREIIEGAVSSVLQNPGELRSVIKELWGNPSLSPQPESPTSWSLRKLIGESAAADIALLPGLSSLSDTTHAALAEVLQREYIPGVIAIMLQNPTLIESGEGQSIITDLLETYFFTDFVQSVFAVKFESDRVIVQLQDSKQYPATSDQIKVLSRTLAGIFQGRLWVQGVDKQGQPLDEAQNGVKLPANIMGRIKGQILIARKEQESRRREMAHEVLAEIQRHPESYAVLGHIICGLTAEERQELFLGFAHVGCIVEDHAVAFYPTNPVAGRRVTFGNNWEIIEVKPWCSQRDADIRSSGSQSSMVIDKGQSHDLTVGVLA